MVAIYALLNIDRMVVISKVGPSQVKGTKKTLFSLVCDSPLSSHFTMINSNHKWKSNLQKSSSRPAIEEWARLVTDGAMQISQCEQIAKWQVWKCIRLAIEQAHMPLSCSYNCMLVLFGPVIMLLWMEDGWIMNNNFFLFIFLLFFIFIRIKKKSYNSIHWLKRFVIQFWFWEQCLQG